MGSQKFGYVGFSFIKLIIAIAIMGISGYSYKQRWHQFLGSSNLTLLSAAKIIPDEAIVTGSISTNKQDWQQLEKLGIRSVTTTINSLTEAIEAELQTLDFNYQRDIKPWLGNTIFAMVPDSEDISESNMLLILGIKNPLNAYKFFKNLEITEPEQFQITNYRGIKITTGKSDRGTSINIVILGNKIGISNDLETVKKAIDTFRGEPSFANHSNNKTALKQSLKLENELAKFYITDYDLLLQDTLADTKIPPEKIAKLQPVSSLVVGIGSDDKQLSIQSLTSLKSNVNVPQYKTITNGIPSKYPEQTLFLINSQGIKQFWDGLINIGVQDRDIATFLDGLRNGTKLLIDLDLDRDIFSWMDGEFGMGIIATENPLIPEINLKLGVAIILQTSDRTTAQNTLNTIKSKIQEQTNINPKTTQFNQETITQWEIPNSNFEISYGWLDRNSVVFTMGNNAFSAMTNSSQSSLDKSSKYQEFAQKIPTQNLSSFYLDLEKIMTEIAQIPNISLYQNSEPMIILNSIKGISAASTMTDSHTTKTDLVFLFK